MSTYRRYQEARDTAWRALLRLEEKRLPVDAEALARRVGVTVHPFPEPGEEPRLAALVQKAGGGRCVSLRIRGAWHVFLREDRLDEAGRRFSLAHELGHLLLGHETRALAPGVRAFCSRENEGDLMEDPDSLEDYAADIFAIRLLAPACVLHELHVDTPGGIMRLCGLPPRAAALRGERMELLNQRDSFYAHPLERQVRDAFWPFLTERAAQKAPVQAFPPAVPPAGPPIAPPVSRPVLSAPVRAEAAPRSAQPQPGKRKRRWEWGLAVACLCLAAALLILLFRR